jgi:hypothetical protein
MLGYIYSFFSDEQQRKVFLVCKITNENVFNEYFPKLNIQSRVQPSWEYDEHKKIIKIKLEDVSFKNGVLEQDDIDIPFFEQFCTTYIYVHYYIHNIEYINVYHYKSFIDENDFKTKNTHEKYKNLDRIILLEKYDESFTEYFKKFLNNTSPITYEMVLLYYDKIHTLDVQMRFIFNDMSICSINKINKIDETI